MSKKRTSSAPPEEAEWIEQARKGDKESYRKIVEHYQDRVFGLILSMVRRREQAEDLTQEVFIKAYFALDRFGGESAFYTWLFRVASNHCLDFLRKRQLSQVSLDAPVDEDGDIAGVQTLEGPRAERPEAGLEDQAEMGGLLAEIDAEQRLVLTLREFQGHSYEEIASIMKCGINTVKSRLNRAREAFKLAYSRKYGLEGNKPDAEFVQDNEEKL